MLGDFVTSPVICSCRGWGLAHEIQRIPGSGIMLTAVNPPPRTDTHDDYIDYKCPICLDWLEEPVTFDCNHSVCHGCLQQTLSSTFCQGTCPVCRHRVLSFVRHHAHPDELINHELAARAAERKTQYEESLVAAIEISTIVKSQSVRKNTKRTLNASSRNSISLVNAKGPRKPIRKSVSNLHKSSSEPTAEDFDDDSSVLELSDGISRRLRLSQTSTVSASRNKSKARQTRSKHKPPISTPNLISSPEKPPSPRVLRTRARQSPPQQSKSKLLRRSSSKHDEEGNDDENEHVYPLRDRGIKSSSQDSTAIFRGKMVHSKQSTNASSQSEHDADMSSEGVSDEASEDIQTSTKQRTGRSSRMVDEVDRRITRSMSMKIDTPHRRQT